VPHERQVIRVAVRDLLIAAATAAGANVHATRKIPRRMSELPALAVYTLEESVDDDSVLSAPRELTRRVSLVIEGLVAQAAGTSVDDDLDALALQVEEAMHADPYLGGTAGESVLSGTELDVVEESDRLLGWCALTYDVTYRTFAPRPLADAAMDDFETVAATHNLGNAVHVDDDAEDLFTVEAP